MFFKLIISSFSLGFSEIVASFLWNTVQFSLYKLSLWNNLLWLGFTKKKTTLFTTKYELLDQWCTTLYQRAACNSSPVSLTLKISLDLTGLKKVDWKIALIPQLAWKLYLFLLTWNSWPHNWEGKLPLRFVWRVWQGGVLWFPWLWYYRGSHWMLCPVKAMPWVPHSDTLWIFACITKHRPTSQNEFIGISHAVEVLKVRAKVGGIRVLLCFSSVVQSFDLCIYFLHTLTASLSQWLQKSDQNHRRECFSFFMNHKSSFPSNV